MVDEIEIILPAVSDEPLSDMLRAITEAIVKQDEGKWVGGFLGGEFGYGAEWDSHAFLMHPYCWCEMETCRWCSEEGCGCPPPEGEHFVDGKPVTSHEYWAANQRIVGALPSDEAAFGTPAYERAKAAFDARVAERDVRLQYFYPARQHTCSPAGLMEDRARSEECEPQTAPNFWHKPSGLKVWWYKYIGRGMETRNVPADLTPVFRDCLADIAAQGMSGFAQDPKGLDPEGAPARSAQADAPKDLPDNPHRYREG